MRPIRELDNMVKLATIDRLRKSRADAAVRMPDMAS